LALKSYEFLFWAYNVIWAGMAAYLILLLLRLGRVGRRLDLLEREIQATSADDQQPSSS
jgi:hypothetical protein